jgi:hypothetical protein
MTTDLIKLLQEKEAKRKEAIRQLYYGKPKQVPALEQKTEQPLIRPKKK